ncbi:MAG: tetratricopeptide repeat protein [Woeseiaceae bacterium]
MTDRIDALLAMLKRGQDSALLRFSLGSEFLSRHEYADAAAHLRVAVDLDGSYSAAWKLLGRALLGQGLRDEARAVYRSGIAVAEARGDKQAAREMTVFLRRLEKDQDERQ